MGWDDRRLDEQRISAPEVPKHRSRKNTRQWCRGKVGVEHVTEMRWPRAGYLQPRGCARYEWWPEHWSCYHQMVCVNCEKIMVRGLGRDCPDFSSQITRWRG